MKAPRTAEALVGGSNQAATEAGGPARAGAAAEAAARRQSSQGLQGLQRAGRVFPNNINVNNNIIDNYSNINLNNVTNNYNSNTSVTLNKQVVNLSSFSFNKHVYSVLEKGLNYALAPRRIPIQDIIFYIEYGIRDLPDNTKYIIRQDCIMVLKKSKPPKSNLSKLEFEALKSLNNNKDIVSLKADKGGSTVILNREYYRNKMLDHLLNSGS